MLILHLHTQHHHQDIVAMSSHREGVNPLRPYYIPPSIGEPAEPTHVPGPNPFSVHGNGTTTGKYASKARDIFSDLDYKDYIAEPSPSAVRTVKDLVDELLWKYTSVLMAQPFEVAKTILQVRSQDDIGALAALPSPVEKPRQSSHRNSIFDEVRHRSNHYSELRGIKKVLTVCNYSFQTRIPTRTSRRTSHPTSQAHRLRRNLARRGTG